MTQESPIGMIADTYAAEAFMEGVLRGRLEAIVVLITMGAGGSHGVTLPLINEFSNHLWERPLPPFRHGTGS